jgi:hypothetical protein
MDLHIPVGFEPAIPASMRPQNHTLDRAATGIGNSNKSDHKIYSTERKSLMACIISKLPVFEKAIFKDSHKL